MKHLIITTADFKELHVTKPWYYFWIFDGTDFKSFRLKDKRVRIAKHWIIKIEEE